MVSYRGWGDLANCCQRSQCHLWIYWQPINSDIVEIHNCVPKSTLTTKWSLPRPIAGMRTTQVPKLWLPLCVSFPLVWLNSQEFIDLRKVYLVHTHGGLGLKLSGLWLWTSHGCQRARGGMNGPTNHLPHGQGAKARRRGQGSLKSISLLI